MLNHKGTQIIHTDRLTLRRFTPDDAEQMYENWAKDERVTRYLTWPPHKSPELTRALLEGWCREYDKPDYYNWAMEYEGKVIGNISVVRINERSEWAELGYCMGYDYWGKGIMTEAAKAVMDYLFAEVGFNRIGIDHAAKNPASGRVAQKCGLSYEGTRRAYYKSLAGEYLDIVHYGILKNDWEKR